MDIPMQHLDPRAAYAFLQQRTDAVLVDCRTETEHMYVGHPVGAEHVAWQERLRALLGKMDQMGDAI